MPLVGEPISPEIILSVHGFDAILPYMGELSIPYYYQNERHGFDVNIMTLKERIKSLFSSFPEAKEQRWLLSVTGHIQLEGSVVTHTIRQVLKDNTRLEEYPFLMSRATCFQIKQAYIYCTQFDTKKNSFREKHLIQDIDMDDLDLAKAMKGFRNRDVEYSPNEKQAIGIWLDHCNKGKLYCDFPEVDDIVSAHTTSLFERFKDTGPEK